MFRDFKKPCDNFEDVAPGNANVCKGGVTSRYLSSEVGYHLKFHFSKNGVPRGCKAFRNKQADWYKNAGKFLGEPGTHGCPLQDHPDEYGEPMHKGVKLYADDGDLWIKDFVLAFDKMQQNGYLDKQGNLDLVLGPDNFWSNKEDFV